MDVHDFVLKIIGDLYKAKKATHNNEVGFELPAPAKNTLTEFARVDIMDGQVESFVIKNNKGQR